MEYGAFEIKADPSREPIRRRDAQVDLADRKNQWGPSGPLAARPESDLAGVVALGEVPKT
jgi:hypothetical protein